MTTPNDEEFSDTHRTHKGFFHRSLSPCSFERLRNEHSDYFYKPKRGPSTSKSNITITRPIKTLETVTKLMELLSHKENSIQTSHMESESLPIKLDEQKFSSQYSSLLSMDGEDLSSKSSSNFSSRSNSSISTVPEQDSHITIIEESINSLPQRNRKQLYSIASCHVPAMGINITMTYVHFVLLELYPQNVDHSTIVFQRHLLSLILDHEHEHWSISNVELQTKIEQEANFRFFSFTHEQFDRLLKDLQFFINFNSSIALSLVLNIALTGEQTAEYEMKISSSLNKINLNFDIIQSRAESYIIGLDFFLLDNHQDELFDIVENRSIEQPNQEEFYPYLLVHAEATTTFFYLVHSSSEYSLLTSDNLCYKTYYNLLKLLHPSYDEQISSSFPSIIRRPPPMSFDLCKNYHHRPSTLFPSQVPMTNFSHIPSRYFPSDYSKSKTSHYIYRGWSNRQISPYNENLTMYDVQTQTDDSFLEYSSLQTRLAMHRSLSSMFTMNMALIMKLLLKLSPSIHHCILIGEFFQMEKQAGQDLAIFLRSITGDNCPGIYQFKRQSLISALGCALPRVYFDVVMEEGMLGND